MFRDDSRNWGFEAFQPGTADAADRLPQHAAAHLAQALKPPALLAEYLATSIEDDCSAELEACALALYDAGLGVKPTSAKAQLPGKWVAQTLRSSLALPRSRQLKPEAASLSVYLGPDENSRNAPTLIFVGAREAHFMVDALPLLMKVREVAPELETWLGKAVNAAYSWLAGPAVYEDILQRFYWEGEEDESAVKEMYAEDGEEYSGVTRARFNEVYPESFRPSAMAANRRQGQLFRQATLSDLTAMRRAKHPMSSLIGSILSMLRAEARVRKTRDAVRDLWVDPMELGYEDWFSFRRAIHFGDEELSGHLIDEAYNMAMQCNYCSHHSIYSLPTTAKDAKALISMLRAIRDEFHATEALVEEMEKA